MKIDAAAGFRERLAGPLRADRSKFFQPGPAMPERLRADPRMQALCAIRPPGLVRAGPH